MNSTVEILSPAGSFDSLKAAVNSGADAVYFGGSKFSARKNAVNFSDEQITEAVKYAHMRGVKLYAAVNTLLFDSELAGAFEYIRFLYESGVDALIIQDFGIVNIIKKYFPDFRIHASTQMTVHNLAGAIQAQNMGFSRVVLSRELSFDEIKYISENSDIELEVFVHGALCMSYSGQCLFSGFLGGRSGNRGYCAQPCRLNYTLVDSEGNNISESGKYLLSLKDLSLIDYIGDLKEIGVTSFKIEGRMKSCAYVSAVTGIFNKYRNGDKVIDNDRKLLYDIFSRNGFTDGYYKMSNGRHMLNYHKSNDDIYDKATDDVVSAALNYASDSVCYHLNAKFRASVGSTACLEADFNGVTFSVQSTVNVDKALNKPVDSERIRQQLEKLGGTLFVFDNLDVEIDDDIFIPIGEVNSMRRELTNRIESYILGNKRVYTGETFKPFRYRKEKSKTTSAVASVLNETQAQKAYELGFDRIYIPYDVYMSNKEWYDSESDIFGVKLPPVNHDRYRPDFKNIKLKNICITNIGQLGFVGDNHELTADYRLNVTNSMSINELVKRGISRICLSAELTLAQIKELTNIHPLESVVYGRIALMTVKNCIVNSSFGRCNCITGETYYLKDRKNISFPVFADKSTCTNIVYNSAPIFMADKMHDIMSAGIESCRYDFTVETPQQMEKIMYMYENGIKSEEFFTRGHFYKGVL